MSVSPLRDHMQLDSNEIQPQIQTPNRSQRLKFRASCDPCAASKVRCTKEQHGCSRCTKNGLKCVYGRSQRKGKPPSNKSASMQQPSPSPPSPPQVPTPSLWPNNREAVHHYPNPHLNTNCIWYRSNMLSEASSQNQKSDNSMTTGGEGNTPSSLDSHQPLPDRNNTPQTSISSGHMSWPNLEDADPSTYSGDFDPLPMTFASEDHIHLDYDDMNGVEKADDNDEREEERERENANENQHEPCITVACRVLSSLYEFVRCDCVNGHYGNSGSSNQCKDLTQAKEGPRSDIVFRITQSATEEVSRLLNCTGIICAQDASILLVLSAILCKILTWYQALYQSEISRFFSDQTQDAHLTTSIDPHHHSSGGTDGQSNGSRQVDGGDSMYRVPLIIPLSTGGLNVSRATETKMKAQLLLCQVQTLHQVCQSLDRRAQAAEDMRGEKSLSTGSNAQLLEKVRELQLVLTNICTQSPEYNS